MSKRLKQKKRTARHPSGRARSARIVSYGIDGQNLSLDRIAELIETDSKIALSKEALVRVLLEDLDEPADPAIDAAWVAEAQRRSREIDDGAVACVPADDVFRRLEASLRR